MSTCSQVCCQEAQASYQQVSKSWYASHSVISVCILTCPFVFSAFSVYIYLVTVAELHHGCLGMCQYVQNNAINGHFTLTQVLTKQNSLKSSVITQL